MHPNQPTPCLSSQGVSTFHGVCRSDERLCPLRNRSPHIARSPKSTVLSLWTLVLRRSSTATSTHPSDGQSRAKPGWVLATIAAPFQQQARHFRVPNRYAPRRLSRGLFRASPWRAWCATSFHVLLGVSNRSTRRHTPLRRISSHLEVSTPRQASPYSRNVCLKNRHSPS